MSKLDWQNLCPHCQERAETSQERIFCPLCGTVHHRRCWQEGGERCAVPGCSGTTRVGTGDVERRPIGAQPTALVPPAAWSVEAPGLPPGLGRTVSFWPRVAAHLIDGLLLSIPLFILFGVAVAVAAGFENGGDEWAAFMIIVLFYVIWPLTALTYYTVCLGRWGKTPGKALLGLRVVSVQGLPIGYGQALLRAVGYLLSGCCFYLGYIWVAIDPLHQGWHDKIAGTYVIYSR